MTTGSVIVGKAELGAIVTGPEPLIWKVILSRPGFALALRIACRNEPSPSSPVVVTTSALAAVTRGEEVGGVAAGDDGVGVVGPVGFDDPPPIEPAGVGFPRVGGLGVG